MFDARIPRIDLSAFSGGIFTFRIFSPKIFLIPNIAIEEKNKKLVNVPKETTLNTILKIPIAAKTIAKNISGLVCTKSARKLNGMSDC